MTTRTIRRSDGQTHVRSALLKQLASALTVIQRELELIDKYPIEVYRRLRRVGQTWKRIKKLLARLGHNIDKWADEHLSITRQWADKHAELDTRWPEFLMAIDWAEKTGWERDRKSSIKAAMEMMEARSRYQSIIAATTVAADARTNRRSENAKSPPSNGKLDLSLVDFRCGDALTVLRSLPDASVNTAALSPPYWGSLRDYGHAEQIGLEPDVEAYIKKVVEVMRELGRVLTLDGTAWVVLGDTYTSTGGYRKPDTIHLNRNAIRGTRQKFAVPDYKRPRDRNLGAKNLMLVPARIALSIMSDVGLTLRAEVIWEKSTIRPVSVSDRPSRSHEFVYLFSKNRSYFYNADAVKEPTKYAPHSPGRTTKHGVIRAERLIDDYTRRWGDPSGRNARTVWRIGPKPYRGNHPATFPVELAERCLRATLPPGGIAIDPFGGAGSTAIAALRLGASKVILIDINQKYLEEARLRMAEVAASPIPQPLGPMILSPSVTLHRGDCRDILPTLPDGSFDMIVADAPYWQRVPDRETLADFHRRNNGQKPRIRNLWDRFHSVDDYLDFTEEWLRHSVRLLHAKASLFVFASQHNIGLINYTFQRLGIPFVNHIVWRKPNNEPNLTGRRLASQHEVIIWGIKQQGYRFNYQAVKATAYSDKKAGIQAHDIWTIPHVSTAESVGHPAQKPLAIYTRLLDMCGLHGGTLLDPFGGSGTAAMAAIRWGMRAALIERESEYVDMIKKRVANDIDKAGGNKSQG